jgi:hypothetical protein
MSATILRFPGRAPFDVVIQREKAGGWLVIAKSHAWLHGDRHSAMRNARWLARNYATRIKEVAE